jgi:hypothetical protein
MLSLLHLFPRKNSSRAVIGSAFARTQLQLSGGFLDPIFASLAFLG